jgi:plastocyanin
MRATCPLGLAAIAALTVIFLAGAGPAAATTHPVAVGDFFFCDPDVPAGACQTVINAGDTVTWNHSSGAANHTVTECGDSCDTPATSPLFDSPILKPGASYSFTFQKAGTYLYHCQLHPTLMRASVVVRAPPATPTPAPTPTKAPLLTITAEPPSRSVTPSPIPSITLSPTRTPGSPTPVRSDITPAPTARLDTSGGGGFPTWAIIVLVVFALGGAIAGFGLFAYRSTR